jgi:hypothetical protein
MGEFDKYLKPGVDRPAFEHCNYGTNYQLGRRVFYESTGAHDWQLGEPTTRRLRIFAVDPSALVREGKYATIEIPYEKLAPGPVGCLFEVDTTDLDTGQKPIEKDPDLDDLRVLLANGMTPSDSNRAFHAQMAYGVASLVHRTFRRALGRQIPWPFPARDGVTRLRIRPFAGETQNAWYDPNQGTLNFGYFYANEKPTDGTLPRGIVYTALSHDIVCHEMTHAMLDALRSNFVLQTSADMSGFHEGFSDLMALFHHFLHKDALRNALARCRGNLRDSPYLSSIGQQFGRASGGVQSLRSACNTELRYDPKMPAHQMGELLMASVFDAFCTVYQRKTAAIMRLATGGTGRLPEGDLPDALVDVLATRAYNLASQFLNMLIRAVDYLPPVDVRLGEHVTGSETCMEELGLVKNGDARLEGDQVTPPQIESVRTLRRIGPDGQTIFDTVAEILQVRNVRPRDGKPGFEIYGGCTLILDSLGNVRIAVLKSVIGERRIDRRLDYLESPASRQFWKKTGDRYVQRDTTPFLALCGRVRRRNKDDDED